MNRTVNNKAPIFARITVKSRRTEFGIKRFISPEAWNPERGMARAKAREANEINLVLDQIRKRVLECYNDLLLEGKEITGSQIKSRFFGEDEILTLNSELQTSFTLYSSLPTPPRYFIHFV